MKRVILSLSLLLSFSILFGGCVSVQQRKDAVISKGIYAEDQAIKAGRFDLAAQYSQQLTRVVAPPKTKIKIDPVKVQDKKTGKTEKLIVVPKENAGQKTVAVDTSDFEVVEQDNSQVKTQVEKDQKNVERFGGQVDSTERAIEKASKKKPFSIFGFIGKFGLFGSIGLVLVLIAVAIFAPQLLPVFLNIVLGIFEALINCVKLLAARILKLFIKK